MRVKEQEGVLGARCFRTEAAALRRSLGGWGAGLGAGPEWCGAVFPGQAPRPLYRSLFVSFIALPTLRGSPLVQVQLLTFCLG